MRCGWPLSRYNGGLECFRHAAQDWLERQERDAEEREERIERVVERVSWDN
jgi:hypothetical protein